MKLIFQIFILVLVLFYSEKATSQSYDESKVPEYKLPDLLTTASGEIIDNAKSWEKKRRSEVLQLFKDEVYGNLPNQKGIKIKSEVIERWQAPYDKAIRKQMRLTVSKDELELPINVLMYLPEGVKNPPIIFGYNYYGNQSITTDQKVVLSEAWFRNNEEFNITKNKATEASRGKRGYRWPIEMILENGFGLATVYYGELDPDRDDFSDGLHPFFYQKDQKNPAENEWGSIGAWAWGASRVLDYLKKDRETKKSKYILFGHSRLGKTALWGGALDQRFDMVISNESGCGGAALSRRKYGETIGIINQKFPHWFADNFNNYNEKEEDLPIDQHMLIALIAPRPVYVGSAEGDQWADPKGEYLSAYHAGRVYELYQKPILNKAEPPKVSEPLHNAILGYHNRPGKHDVTDYDWEQYLLFAKKWLNNE